MPDFSEDNEGIRQFQEDYPEIYYGVVELLNGHHWSREAQALINDYPEIYNPFKKMLEKDLNNKAVLEFEKNYPEVYVPIRKMMEMLGQGNGGMTATEKDARTEAEKEFVRIFLGEDEVEGEGEGEGSEPKHQDRLYKKGDFIGQNYEVYDVLGMGGFGIVYLVYSHEMKAVFALKTFRDKYIEDAETRERFKKECHVWIDLERHPYLVRAYFVEEIAGRLYIVLEYIASDEQGLNSLDGFLRLRPPDLAQSLKWAIQFCYGMEYASSKGIKAHRDIKPANIMIDQNKTIKISDFGLAGVIGTLRITSGIKLDIQKGNVGLSCQTMEGKGFGTPTHMPPEQFTNFAGCDERSDIYSFGVVLYQMASGGNLPFLPDLPRDNSEKESMRFWQEMYRLHCQSPVPKINSPFFPIIQKCLEKEPKKRYRSFQELRSDLVRFLKQKTGEIVKLPELKKLEVWEWGNKGISLANLGKLHEAIACHDKALEINPRDAQTLNNKGLAFKKIGKYQEAIACYDKALEIDPRDVEAWNNKGNALGKLNKPQEAIACYDKALEIDPRDVETWYNKGNTLVELGKPQEAIACYDKALEINPRHEYAWSNKGIAFEKLRKYQEAIACYDKALEINPRHAEALRHKGDALRGLGKTQEAIACYDKAIEINPGYAIARLCKALTEDGLGLRQAAILSYKKFLELAPAQYKEQTEYARKRIEELK